MKKLLLIIVAVAVSIMAKATSFEEFFAAVKEIEGSNYTNVPKFLIPHNDGNIKQLELLEFEELNDSLINKIIDNRSAITINKDVTVSQDIEDDEDVRIYMQTIDEEFHLLIVGIEKENESRWSCLITKMLCDKKVLENPNFIKFVKEED